MTATMTTTSPASHALAAAQRLSPEISARAAEIEAARRLPGDLLATLIDAGCFRTLVPRSHGGDGLDLPAAMEVAETLARADGSVGWTVMIGASSWCDVAGLPARSFDALYADGPDAILAGAFNPSGSAERARGGYRISGRWAFASGCEHASWLFGHCVEPGGEDPELRMVVFRPDEVTIEDTWHVSGLCGTGSHHFRADVTVPADRTFPTMANETSVDSPLVRMPPPVLYAVQVAAVAVGIAQGALDDVLDLAAGKVPLLAGGTLATNPLFQNQLGAADAELRAARALLYADAGAAYATAAEGAEWSLPQRARVRATAAWATHAAERVVATAYRAGGGSSLYVESPLQRRLRDVYAVTQHFLVKADTFTTAGSLLAGQELATPIF